jgi:hypothetical protein
VPRSEHDLEGRKPGDEPGSTPPRSKPVPEPMGTRTIPSDTASKGRLLSALHALKKGDFSIRLPRDGEGIDARIADAFNDAAELNQSLALELGRLARVVGKEGLLSDRARLGAAGGSWATMAESVNQLIDDLLRPVRDMSRIVAAVEMGRLDERVEVEVDGKPLSGEFLRTARTVNAMMSRLASFAAEVTRVAREVGTEGILGGQAVVPGVAGTWKDLTDNVNQMAGNLTNQVRSIAAVTTAVASGDLSKKITVDVRGEILELKDTINTMVDQLRSFAAEVTRVAREVGTQGRLGGQALVPGAGGTWKDLTDNVNSMASNLTNQVRNIAAVTKAVANGDLTKKITVDVQGEILELKNTINTMVDQLRSFASEVTRVAREVGTEGKLGGQAEVEGEGVSGTWKGLTASVNSMASNLTSQVRNIAEVSRAIATGDLSKKITVDARGEIFELKDTINTMVDQLRAFSSEVTRVAHEVGVKGELGGQARVPGAAGTWKDLTDNVNQLAANLTTQVRAIADVATAVAKGDLTRSVQVEARGEVAALKDNINEMIRNLEQQTLKNSEQDWLKTYLAKFSRMLQGQRDLLTVGRLVLSELAAVVNVRQGIFYTVEPAGERLGGNPVLRMVTGYACRGAEEATVPFGRGLIGQCALEKRKILLTTVPEGYIKIDSGLGGGTAGNILILPIMFEGEVKGVLELASFEPFSPMHEVLLEQLCEGIGIVCKTIEATSRTEALLQQSQTLAQELQAQQQELRRSNQMLEEKAELLEERNSEVEYKNQEVEQARKALEEKAEQLTLASNYKSEFLATVSHELRAPLNSLLILSEQLLRNRDGNLTSKQVEFSQTIHDAGLDLLGLINNILDLSKIESGTVTIELEDARLDDVFDFVERTFRPVAESRGLEFVIQREPGLPASVRTDVQRLQQVLKNLLSNAFKFTLRGSVRLRAACVEEGWRMENASLSSATQVLAFSILDSGIGIPPEKQEVIFESFQQVDRSTSRRYGGTGLGLAISRELAFLLGGDIGLESTPGIGSTFTLFLPVPPPAALPAAANGPARSRPFSGATEPEIGPPAERDGEAAFDAPTDSDGHALLGGRSVLVVDDDFRNLFTMINALEPHQMRVRACDNGQEAIEILRSDPSIEAVLMDIMMPGLDGYDTIRAIRKLEAFEQLPIIALTAKAMRGDRQRCLEAGASDYMAKPVDVGRLLSVLSQWLVRGVGSK